MGFPILFEIGTKGGRDIEGDSSDLNEVGYRAAATIAC